ncbi:MAG: hypothetical protein HYX27_11610 [Acidobacteria bacterium]|nr:hypothetical protein [Acidobacteriota bacterium]
MMLAFPALSVSPERHNCRLTLVAPLGWQPDDRFRCIAEGSGEYHDILANVQRFRGQAYLADGALRPADLTPDGLHKQHLDQKSWHLITHDCSGSLVSCARYYPIANATFDSTTVSRSALARSVEWRPLLRSVVEESIRTATMRAANFAELGGWCVAPAWRNTSQALRSVLYMYALGEVLGGTVGLSTATTRHASSSILQRLGARKAGLHGEELPSYFDPMFECEMELLQFDSLSPAPKYATQVRNFREEIVNDMRVVCYPSAAAVCAHSLSGLLNALRIGAGPSVEVNALAHRI